jgi:hypothetical protein
MTRFKMKGEVDESARAATAEDSAVNFLGQHHHAAEIAMRVLYRLALIWKIERDCRLIRDPDDPRLAFQIRDEDVYEVHNKIAELPAASQSDAIAEHYVITLLAEFTPDRAWLTAHNVYNSLAWQRTGHTFHL